MSNKYSCSIFLFLVKMILEGFITKLLQDPHAWWQEKIQ